MLHPKSPEQWQATPPHRQTRTAAPKKSVRHAYLREHDEQSAQAHEHHTGNSRLRKPAVGDSASLRYQ